MSRLPSSLQLEILSDRELTEKLTEALKAIKGTKSPTEEDGYEQQFYQVLLREYNRRRMIAKSKTTND